MEQRENDISILKREHNENVDKISKEYEAKIAKLQEENQELMGQRNFEMDRNLKIEETIDEKNERI